MRPTPIPDSEVWPGCTRRVIAPPSGDLTDTDIAPVEALIDQTDQGPRFLIRCEPEADDLAILLGGGVLWLGFLADHLHPFQVIAAPTEGQRAKQVLRVKVDGFDFEAYVDGVPAESGDLFIRGCIEALEEMLRRNSTQASDGG